jgi:hypothetical protein
MMRTCAPFLIAGLALSGCTAGRAAAPETAAGPVATAPSPTTSPAPATTPAVPAAAVLPVEVRAAADRIEAAQLRRDVEYLASDALRGRDTNSPGFDSAAVYITRRLERAGLRPLGDDGGWLQHYDLRELRVDTAAAWLQVAERRFRFGDDFFVTAFAGPLTGTFPVVFVGHGWTVPGADIDAFAGVDVRGAIVVAHAPPAAPRGVELRRIGRITLNAVPVFEEARRRGAAGILYIAPAATQEYAARMRTAGVVRWEMEPRVPSAYAAIPVTSLQLQPRVVEALFAGERVGPGELLARDDTSAYAASFRLARTVTLNVPAAVNALHRPYNVVALLDGRDPALRNEYVTVFAHLDGAVGTEPVNGDSIYNSADDNATGSAAILAIAEQLAGAPRPARSILFVWDSGEERGLWGTRHFVAHPPVPFENIVAHFNIDMVGATRAAGFGDSASVDVSGPNEVYLTGPGVLSRHVDALLEQVNRSYRPMTLNRRFDTPESEFFYPRTDAGPFLERGVLTIGFFTGIHDRYHLPADELRYLDPGKMEAVARTVLVSLWSVANSRLRPRIDQPMPATVPNYR